jgi:poly(beta-D-mannuronate) lyase
MKRLPLNLAIWSLLLFHPAFGQSESQTAIAGDHPAQLFPSDGIPEPANTIKVSSLANLEKEIATAKPGDRIVLADGIYTSAAPIAVDRQGTAEHPIVISAQTIGGAEITGVGSFAVGNQAQYVVIEGFKFTHAPAIINIPAGANHCRISRNLFELAITGRSPYLSVSGSDCEIDHNEFRNKKTEGEMLIVLGPGSDQMAQHIWIHHNYFHDFKSPPANNCSAIQIGLSGRSMASGWSVTEYNLFVKCAGENEGCICNKSCDNTYRFNTFGEGSTELSIRHGNRCQIYSNFFIGCEGIRFFGHEHRIYDNYFTLCNPAIHIGNGDGIIPPAKLTAHDKPVGEQVVFNTLVNNKRNIIMQGRNKGLGAGDVVVANNIIQGGPKAAQISGPMENAVWQGNIVWDNNGGAGDIPEGGFTMADPKLEQNSTGEYGLQKSSPAIGAAIGSYPFSTIDVNGRPRGAKPDAGAEQFSNVAGTNHILSPTEVGITAVEQHRNVPDFSHLAATAAEKSAARSTAP